MFWICPKCGIRCSNEWEVCPSCEELLDIEELISDREDLDE